MATNSAEGIRWDLNDLFSAHDDPRIEATLNDCHARAGAFAARFRPVMEHPETLTAATLLDALKELEVIYEALGRAGSYAGLLYAADTANPEYQNLEQRVEQRSTEIRNLLLFFEIQWLKADDTIANRLIGDPTLSTYSHYLHSLRRFRPHTLTEPEEKVINERTIPAERLRPAFFRDDLVADFCARKGRQERRPQFEPGSFPTP